MPETSQSAGGGGETSELRLPFLHTGSWFGGIEHNLDHGISVVFCVVMVALGSVQFGFTFGYSSPTQSQMMEDLGLSVMEYSLFGSLVNVGAMVGAIASAQTQSKSFGRRGSLMIAAVPNILGWLLISFTKDAAILYFGRFLVGFGVGIISYTVPIYIAEIAPQESRGTLGSVNQLGIAVGMMLVYLFGTFLHWRVLAVIGILPCVALLPGLFFVPESPWWLAKKGLDFMSSLQCLRGYDTDISDEVEEISRSLFWTAVSSTELRRRMHLLPLMLAVGLLMLQQLSGINALLFYSSYIFEKAGISDGNLATLALGILQVIATAVATWLIDKAGRRILLIVSASGMTLCLLLAAVAFYLKVEMQKVGIPQGLSLASLELGGLVGHNLFVFRDKGMSSMSSDSDWYNTICLLSFAGILGMVVFYSLGVGPIPWLVMSEILPIEIKNYAGNITTLAKFLTSWAMTMSAISLMSWSKGGTFIIYTSFAALTVMVASLLLPETRGRTLQEIQLNFT